MLIIILFLAFLMIASHLIYKHLSSTKNAHVEEVTDIRISDPRKAYFDYCLERFLKNKYSEMIGYKIESSKYPNIGIKIFLKDGNTKHWYGLSSEILKTCEMSKSDKKEIFDSENKKLDEEQKEFFVTHIAKILDLIENAKKSEANSIDYSVKGFENSKIITLIAKLTDEGYQVIQKEDFIRIIVPQY